MNFKVARKSDLKTPIVFKETKNVGLTMSAPASDSSDAACSKAAYTNLNLSVNSGFGFAISGDPLPKGSEKRVDRVAINLVITAI